METTEKTYPTDLQVKTLLSDWLGNLREEGSYVYKDTKGAVTRMLRDDESISEFITGNLKGKEELEILKKARTMAQNLVNGMTTKDTKVFLGDDDSFTNGYIINIATDYFDRKDLSLGEKLDIMFGFAVHEASHINHTDMTPSGNKRPSNPILDDIKKELSNIIEDERIELLVGKSVNDGGDGMPGMTDYLARAKKYIFDDYKNNTEKLTDKTNEPLTRFLNSLIYAVRFPAALSKESVLEHYDELNAVRHILTPFPNTQAAVDTAAERILDVMKDIIKKHLEDKKKKEEQNHNPDNNKNSNKNSKSSQSNNNTSSRKSQSSKDETDKSLFPEDNNQKDNKEQAGITNDEICKELENALKSQDMQKLRSEISKNLNMSDGKKHMSSSLSKSNNQNYINGNCELSKASSGNEFVLNFKKGNKDLYEQSLRRIKHLIPAMSKALRCRTEDRDYELNGMKSGKLQTNKLVSFKMGNTSIFSKKGTIQTDAACICILIDESASMNKKRIDGSRDAAILIKEAVKHIKNLELFIYGFTSDIINIYQERNRAGYHALSETSAINGTPTADAMELTAKRVRTITKNPCLMLILTDGAPDDHNKTILQDKKLYKDNFIPVGIDIAGADMVKSIFKESISTNDMNSLAPTLGQLVRKKLQKMMNTVDDLS